MIDFLEDIREIFNFLFFISLFIFAITAPTFLLVNGLGSAKCENTAEMMNITFYYDFFTGCLINYNGSFYPLSGFRVIP